MADALSFQKQLSDRLAEQLKQGTASWQQSLKPGQYNVLMPWNPVTSKRYRGLNAINLLSQGYKDQRWMTYDQAIMSEGQVRRGEKGIPIQYWQFTERSSSSDNLNQSETNQTPLQQPKMFFTTVFNGEQIDGLAHPLKLGGYMDKWMRMEDILSVSQAIFQHKNQSQPFYDPATDHINLPDKNEYTNLSDYYTDSLRLLTRWACHSDRLNLPIGNPMGSEGYAKEYLRHELSSMMLADELGCGYNPSAQKPYTDSWIKILKEDPYEICRAARDAEKIQKYVLSFDEEYRQTLQTSQQTQRPYVSIDNNQNQPDVPVITTDDKMYVSIPYKEKEEGKSLGALWDPQEGSWYIPAGIDPSLFDKWTKGLVPKQERNQELSQQTQRPYVSIDNNQNQSDIPVTTTDDKMYVSIPYEEKEEGKSLGARWDPQEGSWYIPAGIDPSLFDKWTKGLIPKQERNQELSQQSSAMTPRQEFTEALKNIGCLINGQHPVMDGQKQRLQVDGDTPGQNSGFYIGYLDGHPAGFMKNFRTGVETKWRSKSYILNQDQKNFLQAEVTTKIINRTEQTLKTQEDVAQYVHQQTTTLLQPVASPTPYLRAKGIQPQAGVFTDRQGQDTYVPAIDEHGKQWTTQYIKEDGRKLFAKGGRKAGCFHVVGGFESLAAVPTLVISEGYATAASVSQALGYSTVAAFDAGNLKAVANALHEKYPNKPVIIAGDDDRHLEFKQGINPGKDKAIAAAQAVGGQAIFPTFASKETLYPKDVSPITPQSYERHVSATKLLENKQQGQFTDQQIADLKKDQLNDKQLEVLDRMKQYTDFNDLALKSSLGRENFVHQVKTAVAQVMTKTQASELSQAHQQSQHQIQKHERRLRISH